MADTPNVRFKGFTDDWEQRKLEKIADKVTKKNAGTQYVETLTNSAEFGIISQRDFFDHDVSNMENIDGYYVVEDDTFVYNPRISTSAPVGPINRNKLGRTGVMSPLYTVFKTHDIDSEYLEWFFKSSSWHSFMYFNGDTGARSDRFSIKDAVFFEMPIPVPDIGEQRKIGKYLRQLDSLITLHQRKCCETKELKKYMLQKMFPKNGKKIPEIRFAGFTDDWEQRKFEDIAQRMSNIGISNEGVPSVEYEDVISEQGLLNKDIRQKESIKTGIKFSEEEVLYGKLRPYLHNWLNPDFRGIAVGDWWVLKPVNLDKNFLYRIIQTSQFDNIANQSSGTKMPRADWKLISSTEFCVPTDVEEQQKIGAYFSNLDHLIIHHQRQCDELKEVKKFMLQNMFPQKG